ncbi:hypothetical protein Lsan_1891 [Legionella santicrucis]|uniref:DUF2608 domain-containing protein n=1 Tax=Legionella santicrucis TaxID=45074 RepID=A0A0W0YWR4_9GAMM|nr:DUF2608 domain-containing protein [Legionella santicrucis]KTD61329.1 hypothetical protein Lsan_1891 [Legionella santicrucis]
MFQKNEHIMFKQQVKQTILKVKNVSQLNDLILNKVSTNEMDPKQTVIFFDLDLTVMDRDAIMSDLHPMERRKFIESLGKIDPSLVELAYSQAPYHLIEKEIAKVIQQFQEQGFIVLGFTSRRTGKAKIESATFVEEDACSSLKDLGINFSAIDDKEFDIPEGSFQLENPNLLPYELVGKPKIFGHSFGTSTIFTANYPKGLILESVINYVNSQQNEIKSVIVIDDNIKYLQNLKEVCEKNRLAFSGLNYTYAHDNKKELNEDIISIQKQQLIDKHVLLSDEKALSLLENTKLNSFT